jgi:alpha-D-xyloside xylohydrolase
MVRAGEPLPLNLCRSTWAGGQKYGAAVWSGDIDSTFASLAKQVRAGLNMAMSGIPWWTTDIGGFYGGQNDDPGFRELMIRWFQYAVYCPLFRLHGFRNTMDSVSLKGGDNEVWSFGDQAYPILVDQLNRREALRPKVQAAMDRAAAEGVPPMRPLAFDFPNDPQAWAVDDQFLFADTYLVAPVLEKGMRSRRVYLPAGADWTDLRDGATHPGGVTIEAKAPLESIPVFTKSPAKRRD